MLTFYFTGVSGEMTSTEPLTSGMVGKKVQIDFSSDWDDLNKTIVFAAGEIIRAKKLTGSTAVIPPEVMISPHHRLRVGLYGTNDDGTVVIPTIFAKGPCIDVGADPTVDPVAAELPVWQKLHSQIGDLDLLHTEAKDSLTSALNEVYDCIPVRGEDYWTADDIAVIRSYVDEAILGGQW